MEAKSRQGRVQSTYWSRKDLTAKHIAFPNAVIFQYYAYMKRGYVEFFNESMAQSYHPVLNMRIYDLPTPSHAR
jgi:hypothetical protein